LELGAPALARAWPPRVRLSRRRPLTSVPRSRGRGRAGSRPRSRPGGPCRPGASPSDRGSVARRRAERLNARQRAPAARARCHRRSSLRKVRRRREVHRRARVRRARRSTELKNSDRWRCESGSMGSRTREGARGAGAAVHRDDRLCAALHEQMAQRPTRGGELRDVDGRMLAPSPARVRLRVPASRFSPARIPAITTRAASQSSPNARSRNASLSSS
jgi:hypothetical protein